MLLFKTENLTLNTELKGHPFQLIKRKKKMLLFKTENLILNTELKGHPLQLTLRKKNCYSLKQKIERSKPK